MSFSIREEWKERIVYREEGASFTFDCAWGVEPFVLFVPSPEYWPRATPAWMHNRRDEILGRLREFVGARYVIEEDPGSRSAPREWVAVVAARHSDGSIPGEWLAVLMDPRETAPPDSSWTPEQRARFFADHAGRIGGGSTPQEAVEVLRQLVGRPDLQWGI
ncbi:MAG: hypothetical protein HOZ81_20795 [Streptomyces sp.]|nr:hypothetical protein [Streptomyces sp.]